MWRVALSDVAYQICFVLIYFHEILFKKKLRELFQYHWWISCIMDELSSILLVFLKALSNNQDCGVYFKFNDPGFWHLRCLTPTLEVQKKSKLWLQPWQDFWFTLLVFKILQLCPTVQKRPKLWLCNLANTSVYFFLNLAVSSMDNEPRKTCRLPFGTLNAWHNFPLCIG